MNPKKITSSLMSLPLIFTMTACFLTESPKKFENMGITITLDNTFVQTSQEGTYLFYRSYKNQGMNVIFYYFEEDKLTPEEIITETHKTIDMYTLEDQKIAENALPPKKNNIELIPYSYFEFYYLETVSGTDVKVYTLISQLDTINDIILEINLVFNETNKTYYSKTVFEWINSIKIDDNYFLKQSS